MDAEQPNPPDRSGWVSPPRAFVWAALLFGLPLALVTAPFQAPDEPQHFLRAYQISEGGFLPARQDGRGGGELPASLAEVPRRFASIRFHPERKTSWAAIDSALHVPLDSNRRQFIPFVTAIYSPVAYVPQAIAIAIGTRLGLGPMELMYLARAFNLLAWILLGSLALRITPVCHRPLLLLLLMPMSLFQAASISPDATTNGLAVLFAAMVLRMAIARDDQEASQREGEAPVRSNSPQAAEPRHDAEEKIRLGGSLALPFLAALTVVSAALTLSKFAYLPLAALVLLIPSRRFGTGRRRAAALALFFAVDCAVILLWAPQTQGLNAVVNEDVRASPHRQLTYLRDHPSAGVTVGINTLTGQGWAMVRSFVGWLGSMDVRMNGAFIVAYLAALFLACWSDPRGPPPLSLWRWTLAIVLPAILAIGAVGLLNYVYWTQVGLSHVEGLQGRYLLPLAPAMVYWVWALMRKLPPPPWRSLAKPALDAIATAIVLIGCGYAVIAVYLRYYVR